VHCPLILGEKRKNHRRKKSWQGKQNNAVYKLFAQKRSDSMKEAESPFYLAVNHVKARSTLSKSWIKGSKVDVNKLGRLMKKMAYKSGLENPKLRNHRAQKAMVQTLSDQGVPPTHIAQLSGHKNLKNIKNYSSLSTKQQQSMPNMLANISSEKAMVRTTSNKQNSRTFQGLFKDKN